MQRLIIWMLGVNRDLTCDIVCSVCVWGGGGEGEGEEYVCLYTQVLLVNRVLPINQVLLVNQVLPVNQILLINAVLPINQVLLVNQVLPVKAASTHLLNKSVVFEALTGLHHPHNGRLDVQFAVLRH